MGRRTRTKSVRARAPSDPPPPHTHTGAQAHKKTTKILCKPACIIPKRQNETSSHTKCAPSKSRQPQPLPHTRKRKKEKEKGSRPFHKATTPDSLATVQILRVNSASLRDIHVRAKNKQITKCTIDRFEGQENARSLQAIARQLTHTLTGIAFSV